MSSTMESQDVRRRLPAVGRLLDDPRVSHLIGLYGRDAVRVQARRAVEELRRELGGGRAGGDDDEALMARLCRRIARGLEARLGSGLRRVINATGIFVHTNLGRAPLPRPVVAELVPLLDGYCDLEMDLDSGRRGGRGRGVDNLLTALTGAEAAVVVNNNAAALVLALAAHASGRQVVVSRGELVEIGGSFRIPEILETAGARLVEVGTTNRTRLDDYARAIGEDTALLLKVHPSNYRITGFTEAVDGRDLVALGREHGVPVLVDEGSGLLTPSDRPQLRDHPSHRELIAAGCDLVCGSGDKLLGGPQAGILVGRRELILRCRKHPLYRVLRPNRFTFAALEGVLRRHLTGDDLPLARLWADPAQQRRRLERLAERLAAGCGRGAEVVEANAYLGGGSAPEAPIPGLALALPADDAVLRRLRTGTPAVVGYLREGRLILDLRTVDPADEEALSAAVCAAFEPAATAAGSTP